MHRRAAALVVTATIAHALSARPALAQPRPQDTVRLDVARDDRSASCPDRERVRSLLAARLDRDAITDDATRAASLRFTRSRTRFEALLRITNPGHRSTSRRLRSSAADCARLGDAAVLVLALAIDPLRALRRPAPVAAAVPPPPSPETTAPQPSPTPAPAPPPAVIAAPAPREEPRVEPPVTPPSVVTPPDRASRAVTAWQLAALASMSYGVAPGLVVDALRPGLSLRASMIRGAVMVPVELAVDAPGRFEDRDARVWGLPLGVGVGVCPRFGGRVTLFACATLSVGAVIAWGDGYSTNHSDVAFSAAAGGRAGVEVPLSARWRFVASVDARALVLRPAFEVRGGAAGDVWTASPFAASLSIGVAWQNL